MKSAMKTTSAEKGEEVDDPLDQYGLVSEQIGICEFEQVTTKYPFVVTPYYYSLAEKSADDPVFRQFCPSLDELKDIDGQMEDPLAEERDSPVPGLVHRYPDRVLMVITNVCFMNCRHCTRKRLWKEGRYHLKISDIRKMVVYIKNNPQVRDVIISGGDPLTFHEGVLNEILSMLRKIPHVEIIRIGSRAPVVNPSRITYELISVLRKHRPIWFNTQFNHINEITEQSTEAIQKILEAGIPVNNQAVLLRGINDSAEEIRRLCHGLLKIGVRPYYLFHCDPVQGTFHFRTSISKGIEIIERLRGHTSGLAVPVYVVDAINGGGKIPLQPQYLVNQEKDKMLLRNYKRERFFYNDFEGAKK